MQNCENLKLKKESNLNVFTRRMRIYNYLGKIAVKFIKMTVFEKVTQTEEQKSFKE